MEENNIIIIIILWMAKHKALSTMDTFIQELVYTYNTSIMYRVEYNNSIIHMQTVVSFLTKRCSIFKIDLTIHKATGLGSSPRESFDTCTHT